jgi:muramidase (phage lysozyme)
MNAKPLLDFIAKPESGGDYNIVWGGIAKKDRPKRPLVTMTIAQVLDWQESIDDRYPSEAAGRYQIMEDTLRPLPPAAGLLPSDLFNEANQDKLATVLLQRRGLDRYLAGNIGAHEFANNLAMEWASLPVVTGPKKGRSYYASSLNKSHVTVEAFLAAVEAVLQPAPYVKKTPEIEHNAPVMSKKSPWAALLTFIASLFRKGA